MSKALTPAKPSVLIVIDTRIVGGPGRGLFHFLDSSDHTKFNYELCAFRYTKPGSEEFINEATKRGYNLSLATQCSAFDPRPLWQIWRLLTRGKHNIIQTHGYKGHFIAAALRVLKRVPWIAFSHGWTAENKKVGWYHDIGRRCMMSADVTIAVSGPLAEEIRKSSPDAPAPLTIPNAINLEQLPVLEGGAQLRHQLNIPDECLLLGCFGRLSSEKGQLNLLESLARLSNKNSFALFAGDGPDRASLEERANGLGISERVRFVGHQTDLIKYYDAIDALVIPSLNEGLPNVLLESMAHRKVVVATPVGAIPTILENGKNGFLASGAKVEDLVNALEQLVTNASSRTEMAEAARRLVESRFGARARAEKVIDLYQSVLRR